MFTSLLLKVEIVARTRRDGDYYRLGLVVYTFIL